ncbi:unnamed protein product [Gadus morhua 'NCC']
MLAVYHPFPPEGAEGRIGTVPLNANGRHLCTRPIRPRGRRGSHWHGPTQRQRETPVYQAHQTQEQRAERDSLPGRTFAPGPGLEKTTGDHGRTSSPGYRDSV